MFVFKGRQHSDVPAAADSAEPQALPATLTPSPVAEETVQTVQTESGGKRETVFTCLTVQPNRVPCGVSLLWRNDNTKKIMLIAD